MHRRLALFVLTLVLAGPAGAQQTTPAATPTLRGSQSADTTVGATSYTAQH